MCNRAVSAERQASQMYHHHRHHQKKWLQLTDIHTRKLKKFTFSILISDSNFNVSMFPFHMFCGTQYAYLGQNIGLYVYDHVE